MAYRSGGRTTLGSINLAHHTFSQRGNLEPVLAGLYKGNGRIGQETHIIQQGPFQALHFHCLQTLHDDTPGVDPAAVGGADHVAVHVFRNNRLHPQWERHTTLGFADLTAHRRPARLMAGAYLSMAQRLTGGSPAATLEFGAAPASPEQPLVPRETAR